MQKARHIRRHRSDSDEEEEDKIEARQTNDQQPHQQSQLKKVLVEKSIPKRTATKSMTLSFADEDNEDEDGDESHEFKVKKSKASRQYKRMRQAPIVLESMQSYEKVIVSQVETPSLGGGYSMEELANLRHNQFFSASVANGNDGDSIDMKETRPEYEIVREQFVELTGEEAERMEELGDFVPLNEKSSSKKSHRKKVGFVEEPMDVDHDSATISSNQFGARTSQPVEDNDTEEDARLLKLSRMKVKAMDIESDPDKRVEMSGKLVKSGGRYISKVASVDLVGDDDDAGGWEEMLARRAGIKHVAPAPPTSSTAAVGQVHVLMDGGEYNSNHLNSNSIPGGLTLKQARTSIQKTVDSLTEQIDASSNRRDQRVRDKIQLTDEQSRLDEKVQRGATILAMLQELKLLIAESVGMLREKSLELDKLRQDIVESFRQQRINEQFQLKLRQEILLRPPFEAGIVTSLGSYEPVGALRDIATSNTPSNQCLGSPVDSQDERAPAIISTPFSVQLPSDGYQSLLDSNERSRRSADAALVFPVQSLFDEVRPELISVEEILSKLREFRTALPGRYSVAFISMSLRDILVPLVQADAICSPLLYPAAHVYGTLDTDSELRARPWFNPCLEFTLSANQPTNSHSQEIESIGDYDVVANKEEINTDEDLLPKLVNAAITPWFAQLVSTYLDPYSLSECQRCCSWILTLIDFDIPDDALSTLLKSIASVFEGEMNRVLCFPLLSTPCPEGFSCIRHQLSIFVRLMVNIAQFKSVLSARAFTHLVKSLSLSDRAKPLLSYMLQSPDQSDIKIVVFLLRLAVLLILFELSSLTRVEESLLIKNGVVVQEWCGLEGILGLNRISRAAHAECGCSDSNNIFLSVDKLLYKCPSCGYCSESESDSNGLLLSAVASRLFAFLKQD